MQNMTEEVAEYNFKPFHETYKRLTFTLALGLMFPNPATEKFRIISIVCVLLTCLPLYIIIIMDMYQSWREADTFNLIRHSTVVGPSLGAFLKMFLMYYKRVHAKEIIDEINRDYTLYNSLPKDHQEIAYTAIRNSIFYSEKLWSVIVTTAIITFPAFAAGLTLYSHIFDEEPTRYMVHDFTLPSSTPEKTFTSPYYEFFNTYMLISAIICVVNYVSYDGFFALATNHACLKMNMFCRKLEDVFKMKDNDEMYHGFIDFVEEQRRLFRFVYLIQDTFNIWLGTIFTSTMIQIGSLMFHISAGYGFDCRYSLFIITSIVHIFLPCKYAANLKCMSSQTSTLIYCSGWENAQDRRIRRLIPYIIARAQIHSHITLLYMMDFDMELFVLLMRTSYSMFTLLRS